METGYNGKLVQNVEYKCKPNMPSVERCSAFELIKRVNRYFAVKCLSDAPLVTLSNVFIIFFRLLFMELYRFSILSLDT